MNEYDSELVKTILAGEGEFLIVDSEEEADIVLLNTCAVRENAYNRIRGRLGSLKKYKSRNKDFKIGVLGCMAQNLKEDLLKGALAADLVAGPDSYRALPGLIKSGEKGAHEWKLSGYETYEDLYPRREEGVNAWIAVMRGCDNFCTFCVVPYTRGRERSRSVKSVVKETERLVTEGFKQVTLLGQNVNSYRFEGNDFAALMREVAGVKGVGRIRFTSPHPKDFPQSLIDVIAEEPKVCKQIHLPLQAGSSAVLERMNRTYTKEEYLELYFKLKREIPGVVISTDIIVGFPGESDEDFLETVEVMEKVKFDSAFIFKYSERRGTIAQKKFPDDVPEEIKTERIVRLNGLQKAISLEKNLSHVGEIHEVLIENESSKKNNLEGTGRNDGNKLVLFNLKNHKVGEIVRVKITGATPNVLKGKLV
jgi:tRNA-2-methylthio-N6-dimethylallyladenosine synthase